MNEIRTADGRTWTPAPRTPFETEGDMFRTFACGRLRATLITRNGRQKFVSTSGRVLEMVA